MRTGGTIYSTSTMTTTKATFSPPPTVQRSPWHSPVPYLFGGLAAMLGLIAFALLILACSYWKLSGRMDNGGEGGDRDVEAGDEKPCDAVKAFPIFQEKINVVIMPGDVKATFLATPMSSRASSFGDGDGNGKSENEGEKAEIADKPKQEMGDHDQTTTTTTEHRERTHETQQNQETQEQNHQETQEQNQ